MTLSQIDFPSRISVRAIGAGVVSSFALMILFMALGGAFGLGRFDLTDLSRMSGGFWIWVSAAWIVSLYCAAYVAAIVGRSTTDRDGMLYGFVTWASACVSGCAVLAIASGRIFAGMYSMQSSQGMLWGTVIADALALSAAILGGWNGASSEAKTEVIEERKKPAGRRLEHALPQT